MTGLKDKYCIVGVGRDAVLPALRAQHPVPRGRGGAQRHERRRPRPWDVNGMLSLSRQRLDVVACPCPRISGSAPTSTWTAPAAARAPRLSSAWRCGAIEAGMCHTVAIYRSMNGYSEARMGGIPGGGPAGGRQRSPGAGLESGPLRTEQPGPDTSSSPSPATCTSTARPASSWPGSRWSHSTARVQQPQGLLQAAGDRRRRAELPLDREAGVPPARLLRGDRQRHVPHRHVGGPGPPPPAAAGLHHVGVGTGQRSRSPAMHYQCDPITRQAGYYARADRVSQCRRRAGGHPGDRLLRRLHVHARSCSSRATASAPAGEGGHYVRERGHRAGWETAQQHQRRPSVRGLHPRHEHGDRERPPAAPPGG